MRHHNWFTTAIFIFALILFGNISLFAQRSGVKPAFTDVPVDTTEDLRPFDFGDKYYAANGMIPEMILNRSNGGDGLSVFDVTSAPEHNNIRILAAHSAYGRDGNILYWNFYGDFYKTAFAGTPEGQRAYELANESPIYIFPGQERNSGDRQSAVIDLSDGYFGKNVLGIGVVMVVKYTGNILTKADAQYLEDLAAKNGLSADGTPVISTVEQLNQLQRRGLISVTPRGGNSRLTGFIVGRVIQYPEHGAITPDAFLVPVNDSKGNPLASELHFLKNFECIKQNGSACF
jgi:hypothetical protein